MTVLLVLGKDRRNETIRRDWLRVLPDKRIVHIGPGTLYKSLTDYTMKAYVKLRPKPYFTELRVMED